MNHDTTPNPQGAKRLPPVGQRSHLADMLLFEIEASTKEAMKRSNKPKPSMKEVAL